MTSNLNTISKNFDLNTICKKRLMGDMKILKKDPLLNIDAYPDEQNMLIWYFMIIGPESSDYYGGHYIGKIIHNKEYPFKGPDCQMLTPSGRFDIEKNICLTYTGFHQEEWSSAWNIRTILIGFLSILLDDSTSGISHIKAPSELRKEYAQLSIEYNIKNYPKIYEKFDGFIKRNMESSGHKKN